MEEYQYQKKWAGKDKFVRSEGGCYDYFSGFYVEFLEEELEEAECNLAELASATQKLVTMIVEKEGAFGMKVGPLWWDSNKTGEWLSWPKDRSLSSLDTTELVATLEAVAEYFHQNFEIT